jgi:cytoskeletal protein RodZ
MNTTTGMREKVLRVLIMLAACFAIGSVGFFIAVLLQHAPAASTTVTTIHPVPGDISTSSKEAILESLNGSSTVVVSSTGNSTSTASAGADADAQTAAKLKILEALNAH